MKMHKTLRLPEVESVDDWISALLDGETGEHETDELIDRLRRDRGRRLRWNEYHLIGDVLRQEYLLSSGFHRRLQGRLSEEPTVLAPRRVRKGAWVAAAAVAAVGVLAWNLGGSPEPEAVPAAQSQWARLDEIQPYLVAHEEFTPGVAIAEPALLTVAEVGDGAAR
jgi:sigma-E factor negative regulatory protein RseA